MDLKKWAVAAVGAFAVFFVSGYLIHHVWLGGFYAATAAWWRPADQMQAMFPLMIVGQAVLAALLTLVYVKGYQPGKGGASQGFRFGMLMGLLLMLPSSLIHHVVYPYPASLIMNWFIGGLVETMLAGTVIGALYRPGK
jgi:hypothetical protein